MEFLVPLACRFKKKKEIFAFKKSERMSENGCCCSAAYRATNFTFFQLLNFASNCMALN